MSIKTVCPQDKEHNTSMLDKFCKVCGTKLKFQSYKCKSCGHAEYPMTFDPVKFCPCCGSSDIEFITTDKQVDF